MVLVSSMNTAVHMYLRGMVSRFLLVAQHQLATCCQQPELKELKEKSA